MTTTGAARNTTKDTAVQTHRPDPLSLVTGTIFLVIGLIATLGGVTLDDLSGQWVAPTLLGTAGLALIASVPLGSRGRGADDVADVRGDDPVSPADDAVGEPVDDEPSQ